MRTQKNISIRKCLSPKIIIRLTIIWNVYFQNQRIIYHMYEIEWYRQSIKFRKDMIIFLGLCNKNLKVRLFANIILDRNFLSRAISNTYSFIQFILRTQKQSTWMKFRASFWEKWSLQIVRDYRVIHSKRNYIFAQQWRIKTTRT